MPQIGTKLNHNHWFLMEILRTFPTTLQFHFIDWRKNNNN